MKIRTGFVSNSSTSSFICDTRMTEEEMVVKLAKIIAGYNMMTDQYLKLKDIAYVTRVDKDYWDKWKGYLGSFFHNGKEYGEGYSFEELKGKKVIMGAEDNSIPYELFDIIEEIFDAQRHHFG